MTYKKCETIVHLEYLFNISRIYKNVKKNY
nr:MAG TPA: hypothetical protein [Caudoviricetes sp.]